MLARVPRWQRALPGVAVLVRYEREWLGGDLLAGLTVAAYLVPQVMAYAVIAGLPPVVGLWSIIGPLVVYAVVGSSRQLSIGPESTMAIMTAAGVGALVGVVGPQRYAEVAALLAIAVGILCLVGYVGRLGFLAELLSRPVLVGYMAGIAVLMIRSQWSKVTANLPTGILAMAVLVVLFALKWRLPRLPGPLIAILLATVTVAVFHLDRHGVATVGAVPSGMPDFHVPQLGSLEVLQLVPVALGIAVVGYSDNVLTARAFEKPDGRLDSNQEFLALGLANLCAGLSSGFPVSSSGSRTVLGETMGSRTQVHSLVALGGVLATMFWLGPLLATFPSAALGAVVIYAALRLIDVAQWQRIAAFRWSELVLALVTGVSVLAFDVLTGIGVAVALSLLDLLRRLATPHDGILGYVPGVAGMHDIDDYREAQLVPGLVVYRYDSPLFFANAENFVRRATRAVDESATPAQWFLLNAEANVEVDLTAVDALDRLRESLRDRGIEFAMARVKQELREQLDAAGFVERVGQSRIFPTLPAAVHAYAADYQRRTGRSLADEGVVLPPIV